MPLAVLLLALVPAAVPADGFTRGATVVLVTGLPGDVESERAYEDQLHRLLEALSREPSRPARVFVLADAPDRVRRPASLNVEVRAGSRQSLVGLARDVAAAPGPLVVMVWGHGGPQGTKPVFHVRGPRIDAADLAAFAAASGDRASQWILYFRGSGAFAEALAGAGREVLASEHRVAFRSDPVGVDLLLEALRARPEATFAELAERVGRATRQWYDDQKLARTEEPTLWTAAAARRLAPESTAAMTASVTPAPPPPSAERSADWADITPVKATAHPDADAVVLRRSDRFTFGQSPAVVHEVDQFVQVLTEEGESRGDVDVAFSPPDERVAFLDCEVLRPDGTLVRLSPDEIRPARSAPERDEYPTPHRHVFSLPGVEPGAILRVHYRSEWRRFPLPHIFVEVPLAAAVPVLDARVEVRVGASTPLHHLVAGEASPAAIKPETVETPSGRAYSWRFRDAAPVVEEALAPPGRAPKLLLSTFPDWPAFLSWYQRLIQLADVVTPEIEAQAAALVKGKASEREKVVALYDFVTSLRYVAVPLGVNSHRPHAAARVLANRYGDCKDKANLFNTLLRTQGVAAQLVLVPRFAEAHESLPGLGFNHAISRVRVDGEWVFADTTDEFARFGLLPPGDPGRKVLIVDSASTGLVTLPAPKAADHRISLEADVPAEDEGRSTLAVRAHGFADYALRQTARAAAGQGPTRPLFAEAFRPAAGALGVITQRHTPVSALDRDFEWHAEGTWTALRAPAGDGVVVRAPFWLPIEWDSALHARRSGLFLSYGYPLLLEQRVRLALPAGARDVVLPPAVSNDAGPVRYRLSWSQAAGAALEAALRVELATGEMDAAAARELQAQLRGLWAALARGATYKR